MNEKQKEQIKNIVYTFAHLANINDQQECDSLINKLNSMNEEDVIDYLIVSLNDLAKKGMLKEEDIYSRIDLLTQISSKYPTKESLFERLNFLKTMNMEHPEMPLTENHKLVIEAFDAFNKLIKNHFDTYYTGGLMGYLAINRPLERYHGDLDLFINEDQLEELYELVKQSDDFEFISNMNDKDETGHEFKIQYKGTPMSIGLFLFERTANNEIILKSYYHRNNNPDEELLVNSCHLTYEYSEMMFSSEVRYHNGYPYRMQSLESIYNAKKNARPKDKYDAELIKDYLDLSIDEEMDRINGMNISEKAKNADGSVVTQIEKIMNETISR